MLKEQSLELLPLGCAQRPNDLAKKEGLSAQTESTGSVNTESTEPTSAGPHIGITHISPPPRSS